MSEDPTPYTLPPLIPPLPDIPATWVGGHELRLASANGFSVMRCVTCRADAPPCVEPVNSPAWLAWVNTFVAAHPAQGGSP